MSPEHEVDELLKADVIQPVPSAREFLLVVTLPDGERHAWQKRDLAHARKGVADMLRDMENSQYYRNGSVWIESRFVSPWEMYTEDED